MNANDAFEAFFEEAQRKYLREMERLCFAYAGYREEYRSLVDESIQETFVAAVKEYELIKDSPYLEGWFLKTCFHRFSTALRKERRRGKRRQGSLDDPDAALSWEDGGASLDAWWDRQEKTRELNRLVAALNRRETEIFRAYFQEEKTMEEIAARKGVSLSAVKSLLYRLRKKLRALREEPLDLFLALGATFSFFGRLL